MNITFYEGDSAFDALAGEWNALLERSASDTPFLRLETQRAWWAHKGGGEWPHGDLLLAAGRDEAGRLAGIAPLFRAPQNRDGQAALMLVGSIEISDMLDLIAPPEQLPAFVAALLDALATRPDWHTLDLYNLPEASPTRRALADAAGARGWLATETRLQPCPVIALPGDFDAYLEGIDKKQRHEIRRKLRRAESGDPAVSWRIVPPQAEIEPEIERFLQLMAHDPDKARFLTPPMRAQFHDLIRAAHDNGWLQLAFLQVEGQTAAGYLNFDYLNRLWIYNSALDPQYNYLSAGWVLLGYLLQWANENGRSEFDFMRGDEDYKFKFGGVARYVWRLTVQRT